MGWILWIQSNKVYNTYVYMDSIAQFYFIMITAEKQGEFS